MSARVLRQWLVCVGCVVIGVASRLSHAQGGRAGGDGPRMGGWGGGGQDVFLPTVDSRELDRYGDILGLSGEQADTVRALFEGYNEEFRAASSKARERLEAARESAREAGDRGGFQEVRGMMQEFRRQRDDMERAFFADVQTVLTPDQQSLWPKVERVRRRERTVQRGLMSGERVDVIRLAEAQELPRDTRDALVPLLEQYETELDRALIERNKAYEDGFNRMGDIFGGGDAEGARAEAQRLMENARAASTRVREINRRYARQVQEMLPESARPEFERSVKRASFPRVYRDARVSREIAAAKGFGDLDQNQKDAIATLSDSFQRDIDPLNDQLAKATEEVEETITADRIMRLRRDEIDDGPAGDLWRKRRDMERAASENLRKILRPEQVDRLPRPERDDDESEGRRGRRQGPGGEQGEGTRSRGGGGR